MAQWYGAQWNGFQHRCTLINTHSPSSLASGTGYQGELSNTAQHCKKQAGPRVTPSFSSPFQRVSKHQGVSLRKWLLIVVITFLLQNSSIELWPYGSYKGKKTTMGGYSISEKKCYFCTQAGRLPPRSREKRHDWDHLNPGIFSELGLQDCTQAMISSN